MSGTKAQIPDISHLSRADYESVYEPSEDTYLMMDALEKHIFSQRILDGRYPQLCLEIGSGSGCIIAYLANLLGQERCFSHFIATDINKEACKATFMTLKKNNVKNFDVVQANFADPLVRKLAGKVDYLIWNPPYVLTPSDEIPNLADISQGNKLLDASWAGGIAGREVIDKFFQSGTVENMLSTNGSFFIVLIKQNYPQNLIKTVHQKNPVISGEIYIERRAGIEYLYVLRFWLNKHT